MEDNSGLDQAYTVFEEVFRGMEVVDKIVASRRPRQPPAANHNDDDGQRIEIGSPIVLLIAERVR
jgi:cyclophilin family peptidyl-prolyl cis-trans isomerase